MITLVLDIKDFESGAQAISTRGDGHNQRRILEMLRSTPLVAYSQGEIQEELEIKFPSAVNSALHSLQSKGCVDVKIVNGIQYWRFVHDIPQASISNSEATKMPEVTRGDRSGEDYSPPPSDDRKRSPNENGKGKVEGGNVGSEQNNKRRGGNRKNLKGKDGE